MNKFELSQSFNFDAAHTLRREVPLAEYSPSMTIHGHSYTAVVTVRGDIGADGMIEYFKLPKNSRTKVDLFYLRERLAKVRTLLDHKFLDEVEDLKVGTLENLCVFIYKKINDFPVSAVTVSRPSSGDSCTYRP